MHGDKDTFRLAFSLAGKVAEHRQVTMPARDALGYSLNATAGNGAMFQHQGMVQHTPGADQRPAFLHRTGNHSERCMGYMTVVRSQDLRSKLAS